MRDEPIVILIAKGGIGELIELYLDGKIPYAGPNSLYSKVQALGYNCSGLYEMVRSAEWQREHPNQ